MMRRPLWEANHHPYLGKKAGGILLLA